MQGGVGGWTAPATWSKRGYIVTDFDYTLFSNTLKVLCGILTEESYEANSTVAIARWYDRLLACISS